MSFTATMITAELVRLDSLIRQAVKDRTVLEVMGTEFPRIKKFYKKATRAPGAEEQAAFNGKYFLHEFVTYYAPNPNGPNIHEDLDKLLVRFDQEHDVVPRPVVQNAAAGPGPTTLGRAAHPSVPTSRPQTERRLPVQDKLAGSLVNVQVPLPRPVPRPTTTYTVRPTATAKRPEMPTTPVVARLEEVAVTKPPYKNKGLSAKGRLLLPMAREVAAAAAARRPEDIMVRRSVESESQDEDHRVSLAALDADTPEPSDSDVPGKKGRVEKGGKGKGKARARQSGDESDDYEMEELEEEMANAKIVVKRRSASGSHRIRYPPRATGEVFKKPCVRCRSARTETVCEVDEKGGSCVRCKSHKYKCDYANRPGTLKKSKVIVESEDEESEALPIVSEGSRTPRAAAADARKRIRFDLTPAPSAAARRVSKARAARKQETNRNVEDQVGDEEFAKSLGGLEERIEMMTSRVEGMVADLAAKSISARFARCEFQLGQLTETIDKICEHIWAPERGVGSARFRPAATDRAAANHWPAASAPTVPRPQIEGNSTVRSGVGSLSPLSSNSPSDAEGSNAEVRPEYRHIDPIQVNPAAADLVRAQSPLTPVAEDPIGPTLVAPPATTASPDHLAPATGTTLLAPTIAPSQSPPAAVDDEIEMAPPSPCPPLVLIPPTPVNSQDDAVIGPVPLPMSPPAAPLVGPSPPFPATATEPTTTPKILPTERITGSSPSVPVAASDGPTPTAAAAPTPITSTGPISPSIPLQADFIAGPSSSLPVPPSQGDTPATGPRSRTPRARTPVGSQLGTGPVTRSRSRSRSPNPVAGDKRRAEDEDTQPNKKTRVYVELPPHT